MQTKARFLLIWTIVFAALFLVSIFADNALLNIVSEIRASPLDMIAKALASVSLLQILVVIAIVLLMKKIHLRRWLLAYVAASGIVWLSKLTFARSRPFEIGIIQSMIAETGYSFPSGHATVLFAAFPIMIDAFPRYRYFIASVFLVLILSRVYVGIHYFSDIFGGALLGIVISSVVTRLASRFLEPHKPIQ